MSYLNNAQDPQRRVKAVIAVGAIHALLAYGIVTGLGVDIVERLGQPPLEGTQIPLPPPPPDPDPPKPRDTIIETPVAPKPPIDVSKPAEVIRDPIDETDEVFAWVDTDVRPPQPPLPPPQPRPSFTPKRAVPSNSSAGWISTNDYPRRPLIDGIEGSVGYRLVVGTNGRVASCELTRPSGNKALDDATCRLITNRARFDPATDETGAKVLGTFTGSVRWEIPD